MMRVWSDIRLSISGNLNGYYLI